MIEKQADREREERQAGRQIELTKYPAEKVAQGKVLLGLAVAQWVNYLPAHKQEGLSLILSTQVKVEHSSEHL